MDPAVYLFPRVTFGRPIELGDWMLPVRYSSSYTGSKSSSTQPLPTDLPGDLPSLNPSTRFDRSDPFSPVRDSNAFSQRSSYELASINSVYAVISPPGGVAPMMKLRYLILGSGAQGYLEYLNRRLANCVGAYIGGDTLDMSQIDARRLTTLQDEPLDSPEVVLFLNNRVPYVDLFIYGGVGSCDLTEGYIDTQLEESIRLGLRMIYKRNTRIDVEERQIPSLESGEVVGDDWEYDDGLLYRRTEVTVNGGSLIAKLYDTTSSSATLLIYNISRYFEWIVLMKPVTTHPASSDVYLVGYNCTQPKKEWVSRVPSNFTQWLNEVNGTLNKARVDALSNINGVSDRRYDCNAYLNFLELPGASRY